MDTQPATRTPLMRRWEFWAVVAIVAAVVAVVILVIVGRASSTPAAGGMPKCADLVGSTGWTDQAYEGCTGPDGSVEVFVSVSCEDGREFAYSKNYAGFTDGLLVDREGVDTSSFDNPDYAACRS